MTVYDIARLIDISAVRADSTKTDVDNVIKAAKDNQLICVFSMPSFASYVVEQMNETFGVEIGGVVGFPSGAETTSAKLFQAKEMKAAGCTEIDMVLNIGKLKSGMYDDVLAEIKAVREVVAPLPLKVIMEVALLTDEEIVKASLLIRDGGATFVKTGTGWAGATTFEHVKLIKDTVGDSIRLKVAGGVRDLDTLIKMYEMGVSRFGIGYKSVLDIIEEAKKRYE